MMPEHNIHADKITRPIQLQAAWLITLLLLVGAFLTATKLVVTPPWMPIMFGITAVLLVPAFAILVFCMQTKYRPLLQEDHYYAQWITRKEAEFRGFAPENLQNARATCTSVQECTSWKEIEVQRVQRYAEHYGLFLVHDSRPSQQPHQVADIAISLHQHRTGPLSEGNVESVEYYLGEKFFECPVIKRNEEDRFRLDISAYGPVLCLARVSFKDKTPPLTLERYINF
jgi:hypothetical protein